MGRVGAAGPQHVVLRHQHTPAPEARVRAHRERPRAQGAAWQNKVAVLPAPLERVRSRLACQICALPILAAQVHLQAVPNAHRQAVKAQPAMADHDWSRTDGGTLHPIRAPERQVVAVLSVVQLPKRHAWSAKALGRCDASLLVGQAIRHAVDQPIGVRGAAIGQIAIPHAVVAQSWVDDMPRATRVNGRQHCAAGGQHEPIGLPYVLMALVRYLCVSATPRNLAGQANVHIARHQQIGAREPVLRQYVVDAGEGCKGQHVAPRLMVGVPERKHTAVRGLTVTPEIRGTPEPNASTPCPCATALAPVVGTPARTKQTPCTWAVARADGTPA